MDFMKPLKELISECGEEVFFPKFVYPGPFLGGELIKAIKLTHPAIRILTEENITEKIFADVMLKCFKNKKKDMWFEKRVNLWKLANIKDPYEAVKKFVHLLQPDVDLLYGQSVGGKRQAPMVGVEVKLYSRYTGYGKKIAKTTAYEGYYAGLDEAISLLTLGIDYVYLWHVHVFPEEFWNKLLKYGKDFIQRIKEETIKLWFAGDIWIMAIIKSLNLPMGYVNSYMSIDSENESFYIVSKEYTCPPLNPWSTVALRREKKEPEDPSARKYLLSDALEKPSATRRLLLDSLNIEAVKTGIPMAICPSCEEGFLLDYLKSDYKFCPYCGTQLESKT